MKYFLLIGIDNNKYSHNSEEWIGCFETKEEAKAQIIYSKGLFPSLFINNKNYDNYRIVNLQEWITK